MCFGLYCNILQGHGWVNLYIHIYVGWYYLDCAVFHITDLRNFVMFILKVLVCNSL